MSVPLQSSDLGQQPLFETTDPALIGQYMSDAFRPNDSRLCQPGRQADFWHRQVAFANSSINAVRYGREALVDAPPIDDVYLGMFTLAGTADVEQGQGRFSTRPGSFCVLNPNQHLHVRLSEDFEQLTIRIRSDLIQRALRESSGLNIGKDLEFSSQNMPLQAEIASFGSLLKAICQDFHRQDSGLAKPVIGQHLEQLLAGLLVAGMPHNYSEVVADGKAAPRPFYIKRAEQYMREHLAEPVSMSQLAAAAATSVRSLQTGFRHYHHCTPTQFLRQLRLQQARALIVQGGGHITDVALRCGFSHPGKFAAYYQQYFGELPTDTRRHMVANRL